MDELNNMRRRVWGLTAAVDAVLDDGGGCIASGVIQLVNDVAEEMDRLCEAFEAEHWLARGTGEAQS